MSIIWFVLRYIEKKTTHTFPFPSTVRLVDSDSVSEANQKHISKRNTKFIAVGIELAQMTSE